MNTMFALLRTYPGRSALMLTALIVAGAAEGLSLTALLPLLSVATGEPVKGGINDIVLEVLRQLGIEPNVGAILVFIVCGIAIKSLLVLVANRQVGHSLTNL